MKGKKHIRKLKKDISHLEEGIEKLTDAVSEVCQTVNNTIDTQKELIHLISKLLEDRYDIPAPTKPLKTCSCKAGESCNSVACPYRLEITSSVKND